MRSVTCAVAAVEEVRRDDLVVVVGGVGEGAAAVALAERPDAGDAGGEPVVDGDVAAASVATPAASSPRSSVLGRRPMARRTWLATSPPARRWRSRRRPRRRRACGAKRMHSALVRTRDALGLEDAAHRLGDVRVLAADQVRRLLDQGDLGAEAAVALRELEADVAAADHHEVGGQLVEREDAGVGQRRDVAHPGQAGDGGAGADVEEDARRPRGGGRRRRPRRRGRSRAWPAISVQPSVPPSQSSRPVRDSATMASTRAFTAACRRVTGPGGDAVVGGAAGHRRDPGAGDQRLGRACSRC